MHLLKQLCAWMGAEPAVTIPLHSPERMRAILERERMRADRGNTNFALLTLQLSTRVTREQWEQLGELLIKRVRATDDVGLLNSRLLGVILPETPVKGAWKVARDVLAELPVDFDPPTCNVYVHPALAADDVPYLESEHEVEQEAPAGEPVPAARSMETWFVRPTPGWKRAVDIAGALVGLILTSPILLVTAIAIKATSKGPVFFTQPRDTIGGRRFNIYKFRTMVVDAEEQKAALRKYSEQDGPAFKMVHDPRITKLGRFLRKTSIDELPQFINVLKGDMSLVGPRPLPCDESSGCQAWQRRRLDVAPGLTCIWQVYGRSRVSFAEWIRMDLRYARKRSLLKDLLLILQTVPAVVLRRGAR